MKRLPVLAAIGIATVAAGAVTVALVYSWSRAAFEEQRLGELCGEVVAVTTRRPVDPEACQALLLKVTRDPRAGDPRLVRGRAELMLLLGKPTQQAWEVVEGLVTGTSASPEDLLLGARILQRRHAETGKASEAFRGARLAEQHFDATGRVESLLMAWLLSFRAQDEDGAARIKGILTSQFADSISARLVAALATFYESYVGAKRSVDSAALETLTALDAEVETAPPELTIALCAKDIDGSLEQVQSGLDRLEAVVENYRSSILARELLALGYVKLRTVQGCEQSLFHLDWLLRSHPNHRAAEFWRNLRPAVQGELERLRKGARPGK